MKIKNVIAAAAAVSLLAASGVCASAMQGGDDEGIMPLYYCVHDGCESLIPLVEECNHEKIDAGGRTHKWGFLWQNTCNVKGFDSSAQSRCVDCGHTITFDGRHYCFEEHDSCGDGTISYCPFGG